MNRPIKALQQMEESRMFDLQPAFLESVPTRDGYGKHHFAGDDALRLVHQVFRTQTEQPPRVVVFAGMDHGNGCSEISGLVAEALAGDEERSVCLLDADFRSRTELGFSDATKGYGLTEALICKMPIRSLFKPSDVHGNLWLLSRGPLAAHSPGLLSSGSLRERMEEMRASFDFVIIDSAPLRYADAIALAQLADGLVLIVEEGNTRRDETVKAVASLRACNVKILAAVLNKSTSPVPPRIDHLL